MHVTKVIHVLRMHIYTVYIYAHEYFALTGANRVVVQLYLGGYIKQNLLLASYKQQIVFVVTLISCRTVTNNSSKTKKKQWHNTHSVPADSETNKFSYIMQRDISSLLDKCRFTYSM